MKPGYIRTINSTIFCHYIIVCIFMYVLQLEISAFKSISSAQPRGIVEADAYVLCGTAN